MVYLQHFKPCRRVALRLIGTIISLIWLISLPFAYAVDDADSKEQEAALQAVRAKIKDITASLHAAEKQRNDVQAQLHETETRLSKINRAIRNLNSKIRKSQKGLKGLKRQQARLEKERAQQQSALSAQVRAAYVMGHQENLKILLNQESSTTLSRVMTYHHYFNKARLKIIHSAQQTLLELDSVEKDILAKSQHLTDLQAQLAQQQKGIKREQGQRQSLLATINKNITSKDQAIALLKADEKRIQQLLQSLNNVLSDIPVQQHAYKAFHSLKGKLLWPVRGRFLNRFGEPRHSGDLIWRGVSIQAKSGTQVKAVSHGRVAFADWLQGFGLIIIIDHQDGYMSLYAHNQTLLKETGDWINAGELISTVGDSGGQDHAGLYFEIRHQGTPVDPARWCIANKFAKR